MWEAAALQKPPLVSAREVDACPNGRLVRDAGWVKLRQQLETADDGLSDLMHLLGTLSALSTSSRDFH